MEMPEAKPVDPLRTLGGGQKGDRETETIETTQEIYSSWNRL